MKIHIGKTSTGKLDKVWITEDGISVSSALVTVNPTGKWMKISRVHTKMSYRRQGYGKILMKAIIDNFGQHELRLNPHPCGYGGLDYNSLREFYSEFGFRDIEGQKRMVRPAN